MEETTTKKHSATELEITTEVKVIVSRDEIVHNITRYTAEQALLQSFIDRDQAILDDMDTKGIVSAQELAESIISEEVITK